MVEHIFNKKRIAIIASVIVLSLILVVGIIYLHAKPGRDARKAASLNNSAADLQVKGDYSNAAKKEIEAYKLLSGPADKAEQALTIAGIYESARDYKNAQSWYKIALQQYDTAKDSSGAATAQSSINRVQQYQHPSPPDKTNRPTDGGR